MNCCILLVYDNSPIRLSKDQESYNTIKTNPRFIEYALPECFGPANARNLGINKFLESPAINVICLTDTDCLPSTDWVECMYSSVMEKKYPIVTGHQYAFGTTYFDKFHDQFGTIGGRRVSDEPKDQMLFGPCCDLGFNRDVATNVKFDTTLPFAFEDADFCLKARNLGYKTHLEPKIKMNHDFMYDTNLSGLYDNLKIFVRRHYKYGQSEHFLHEDYPEMTKTKYWFKTEGIPTPPISG